MENIKLLENDEKKALCSRNDEDDIGCYGGVNKSKKCHPPLDDVTKKKTRSPLETINVLLTSIENRISLFISHHKQLLTILLRVILFIGFFAYVVTACVINFKRARKLVCLTVFSVFCFFYWLIKKYYGDVIWRKVLKPIDTHFIVRFWVIIKWTGIVLFVCFLIFWMIYDTSKNRERLVSLGGLFVYVLIGFLSSRNRDQIKWRPVLWGLALQFVLGLFILRTSVGYVAFKWMGDCVTTFLSFSSAGAKFLFGDIHNIAFTVLPVIVYFASFTYILYYLGVIQILVAKIAWILQITMGTSPAESFNAAGNIFIGQTEAPLLIRPFLKNMTESELHAVMTGGFATIAGSVFAAYVSFGVSPHHLLTASVMSAPAALAVSKLMCPEVEETELKNVDDIHIDNTEEVNIFEAVSVGASMSIGLVANIAVMLIAFISLLECANSLLGWLGSMVGEPHFSFEYICSYLFMPFAFLMGVPWSDCFKVAELLGVKTFINEFVAYQRLSVYIKNKARGSGETLSTRSEIIATYALCGFANFGSIGIQLGGLSVLAPNKKAILSRLVFRAMCAGTLACFMTACIANVLYDEDNYRINIHASPTRNTTTYSNLL